MCIFLSQRALCSICQNLKIHFVNPFKVSNMFLWNWFWYKLVSPSPTAYRNSLYKNSDFTISINSPFQNCNLSQWLVKQHTLEPGIRGTEVKSSGNKNRMNPSRWSLLWCHIYNPRVYDTSILRHVFARPNFLVQNSLFYTTTTLDNTTFRISVFVILKR
jgi:hypothetical protein